jgi:probable aminopeptidase NPEPL1
MATELELLEAPLDPSAADALFLIARRARWADDDLLAQVPADVRPLLPALLEAASPGDDGAVASTWSVARGVDAPQRVVLGVLPEACSRHNAPSRSLAVAHLLNKNTPNVARVSVVVGLDTVEYALATVLAAARAWMPYSRKTSGPATRTRTVHLALLAPDGPVEPAALDRFKSAAEAVRFAARLVETPTAELHTDAFVLEARQTAQALGAGFKMIQGEALAKAGLGGLWGVGRAAPRPPALVVLSHTPANAERVVCWVGKGIVYDTGGLSLKDKTGMPGMKRDMGGAAAVIAAFAAAVRSGFPHTLHAVLCLAENAIGPDATRNDDILTMYSGRTVEVNNTDAEGRLVLADGLAWAIANLRPDVLVDLATLTGAQLMSTGRRHAAIVTNDEALEDACAEAGRYSGDLVHALPFAPEFFRAEFKSDVADMKNSVKDRMNAQSSCAAQFIHDHLGEFKGPWLHVDMAGPVEFDGRGSGYGVGLLLALFDGRWRFDSLAAVVGEPDEDDLPDVT